MRALRAAGLADVPPADSRLVFHHDSPDEWATQFVDRPHPTTMFEVDAETAVLEHVGATDRLQLLHSPAGSETAALMAIQPGDRT